MASSTRVIPGHLIVWGISPNGKSSSAVVVGRTGEVDPSKTLELTIRNLTVEGACVGAPALMRVTPLVNYKIVMQHVNYPDGLLAPSGAEGAAAAGGLGLGESKVPAAAVEMEVVIEDWSVAGERVSMSNFQRGALGQLDIDVGYWGQWKITP